MHLLLNIFKKNKSVLPLSVFINGGPLCITRRNSNQLIQPLKQKYDIRKFHRSVIDNFLLNCYFFVFLFIDFLKKQKKLSSPNLLLCLWLQKRIMRNVSFKNCIKNQASSYLWYTIYTCKIFEIF